MQEKILLDTALLHSCSTFESLIQYLVLSHFGLKKQKRLFLKEGFRNYYPDN